jgi:hypothetical protein
MNLGLPTEEIEKLILAGQIFRAGIGEILGHFLN